MAPRPRQKRTLDAAQVAPPLDRQAGGREQSRDRLRLAASDLDDRSAVRAQTRRQLGRQPAIGVKPISAGEQSAGRLPGELRRQRRPLRLCDIRRIAEREIEALFDAFQPIAEAQFDARREPQPLDIALRHRQRLGAGVDAEAAGVRNLRQDAEQQATRSHAEIDHSRLRLAAQQRHRRRDQGLALRPRIEHRVGDQEIATVKAALAGDLRRRPARRPRRHGGGETLLAGRRGRFRLGRDQRSGVEAAGPAHQPAGVALRLGHAGGAEDRRSILNQAPNRRRRLAIGRRLRLHLTTILLALRSRRPCSEAAMEGESGSWLDSQYVSYLFMFIIYSGFGSWLVTRFTRDRSAVRHERRAAVRENLELMEKMRQLRGTLAGDRGAAIDSMSERLLDETLTRIDALNTAAEEEARDPASVYLVLPTPQTPFAVFVSLVFIVGVYFAGGSLLVVGLAYIQDPNFSIFNTPEEMTWVLKMLGFATFDLIVAFAARFWAYRLYNQHAFAIRQAKPAEA